MASQESNESEEVFAPQTVSSHSACVTEAKAFCLAFSQHFHY